MRKYYLEFYFKDMPECNKCMLCRTKGQDINGETVTGYAALGSMPKCPDDGYRPDCPLKIIQSD